MACPYFVPAEPWSDAWTGPRRVPLGQPFTGACSQTTQTIPPREQATLCNFGYARNRCTHFPESAGIDAVRFSMLTATELIWIAEREHAPVTHGNAAPPPEYAKLAQAFKASYDAGKSPQGSLK